ncbi:hypothetical protein AAFC00_002924 [Neodothiora populina]|uniref:SAC3/GANP/THP3 conserved domain-containing protein n=1 Tax=Neodothiora populina TaxID=2781224 RepID=A0ABR3PA11_9PEZI
MSLLKGGGRGSSNTSRGRGNYGNTNNSLSIFGAAPSMAMTAIATTTAPAATGNNGATRMPRPGFNQASARGRGRGNGKTFQNGSVRGGAGAGAAAGAAAGASSARGGGGISASRGGRGASNSAMASAATLTARKEKLGGGAGTHDGKDASFQDRYQQLKKMRERERAEAIANGFLADPDKPRTLAEAITPIGTCPDMCAEFERVERVVQNDVWAAEQEPGNDSSAPAEARMVKKFRRAAAGLDEQLPSDLRPPAVLKATCDYLFNDIITNAESLGSVHHFVWDRTRAIRNDFSIQQLTKPADLEIAIDCYERIARFHILSLHQLARSEKPYDQYDGWQEREQLDRTLLSLGQYYDDTKGRLVCPNEAEFRAYSIIFQAQNPTPDVEEKVNGWAADLRSDFRIRKALDLYNAACNIIDPQGPLKPRAVHPVAQEDWNRYFALVRSNTVSYLMACVSEIYFNLMRRTALNAIWRASRPQGVRHEVSDFTLTLLTDLLAFDDWDQTENFCQQFGFVFKELDTVDEPFLDLNSVKGKTFPEATQGMPRQTLSARIVEIKRAGRTLSAVIAGMTVVEAQNQGLVEEIAEGDEMEDEDSLFVPDTRASKPSTFTSPFASNNNNNLTGSSPFVTIDNKGMSTSSPFATTTAPAKTDTSASNPWSFPSQISKPAEAAPISQGFGAANNPAPAASPFSFGQPSAGSSAPFSAAASDSAPKISPFAKPFTPFATQQQSSVFAQGNAEKTTAPEAGKSSDFTKPPASPFGFTQQGSLANGSSASFGASASFGMKSSEPDKNDTAPAEKSTSPFSFAGPPKPSQSFTPTLAATDATSPPSLFARESTPKTSPFVFDKAPTPSSTTPPVPDDVNPVFGGNNSSINGDYGSKFNNTNQSIAPETGSSEAIPSTATPPPPSLFQNLGGTSDAPKSQPSKPPPSLFPQPNQPKKPSPLSRSFSAAAEEVVPGDAVPPHPPAKSTTNPFGNLNSGVSGAPFAALPKPKPDAAPSNAVARTEPLASKPVPPPEPKLSKKQILQNIAREVTLDVDTGFIRQYVEFHARQTILEVYDQLYTESLQQLADNFRAEKLSFRYGKRWRDICWRRRLARQGREKRQRAAKRQHAREMEKKIAAENNAVDNFLKSVHGKRPHDDTPRKANDTVKDRPLYNASTGQDQSAAPGIFNSTNGLDLHSKINKPATAMSNVATPARRQTPQVSLAGTPATTTRSNYFRLRALGIDPNGAAASTRKRAREDSEEPAVESPIARKTRLPANTDLLNTAGTEGVISPVEPSAQSPASSRPQSRSRVPSKTEEEDEALFARARAARQALSESAAWYRSETQNIETQSRQELSRTLETPSMQRAREMARLRASTSSAGFGSSIASSILTQDVPAYRLRESRFLPRDNYTQAVAKARDLMESRSRTPAQQPASRHSPSMGSVGRIYAQKVVQTPRVSPPPPAAAQYNALSHFAAQVEDHIAHVDDLHYDNTNGTFLPSNGADLSVTEFLQQQQQQQSIPQSINGTEEDADQELVDYDDDEYDDDADDDEHGWDRVDVSRVDNEYGEGTSYSDDEEDEEAEEELEEIEKDEEAEEEGDELDEEASDYDEEEDEDEEDDGFAGGRYSAGFNGGTPNGAGASVIKAGTGTADDAFELSD